MRCLVLLLFLFSACALPEYRCDLLLSGGRVVDGTGAPARRADVLVQDGHILAVLRPGSYRAEATRRLEVAGRVVAPGFIDPHAHGDPRRTPAFANFLAQGVTSICLGMDGRSAGPGDFEQWLERVQQGRTGPDVLPFVGHGSVRQQAAADLEKMEQLIEAAMRAGAWGLSTGIEYTPGRFADAEELARVAAPVGRHGGLVMSHIRSEDEPEHAAAVQELLDQCRAARCRAHVSHLKVVYGKGAARAEQVLQQLARARAAGQQVSADVYPYIASYTGLSILFPAWARPPADYRQVAAARREELLDYLQRRVEARNGPEATLFGTGRLAGKTLAQVAEAQQKPFAEVLLELGPRGASAAYFVMDRELMQTLLCGDEVVVCSDGSPTMRHPRGHGAFARVIRQFVVEEPLLSLEQAVHKMSGATAALLGLADRGRLQAGMRADICVFDPGAVRDAATFSKPFEKAQGMFAVFVAGEQVWEAGRLLEARPGRVQTRPR